jgi:hypothetical protein
MTIGRNDRNVFAALSAEEERRRTNEQTAGPRRDAAVDFIGARTSGDERPGLISKIVGAIRRAFGR